MEAPRERTWRAWWVWLAIVVGSILLYWPAIHVDFLADDIYQIALFDQRLGPRTPWSLYSLFAEDPATTTAHMRRGSLPWWTVPEFRFVQVRPLSSLLLALDHTLWPRRPDLHHIHALGWLVAMLGTAHLMLRRTTTPAIATAAVLVFAIDETLGWTVAWLANRCALVAATFVFAAITQHLRTQTTKQQAVEFLLWGVALAAGEYALCGIAYVLAYALIGRRDPWPLRIRSLVPAGLATFGFIITSFMLGAGVHGATSYIDPWTQPWDLFYASVDRIPRMLGEIWLTVPAAYEPLDGVTTDLRLRPVQWLMVDAHRPWIPVVIAAVIGCSGWLAHPWLTASERRAVAWTALGSLGALAPLVALLPATRTLAFAALGPAVFVGSLGIATVRALHPGRSRLRTTALAVLAGALLTTHVLLDAQWVRIQIAGISNVGRAYREFYRLPDPLQRELQHKHVIVLGAPDLVTGIHGLWMLGLMNEPMPLTWHSLSIGMRRLVVRRFDARTLQISGVGAVFLDQPQETLFRPPTQALHRGDVIELGLFRATVVAERRGHGPTSIQFTFDRPVDDPDLVFMVSGPEGLQPLSLPSAGQTIVVPPAQLPLSRRPP